MRTLTWTDSVRAVSCLAVVVWHVVHNVLYLDPTALPGAVTTALGLVAREAVMVFICLSGFLLGRHWVGSRGVREQVLRYALRRGWRILPPYWAALAITIAAMAFLGLSEPSGTPWDEGLPFDLAHTLAAVFLVTDLLGWVPLAHPLWAVPVELHLYALGPLVVVLARRRAVLVVATAISLACFLLIPFPAPVFPLAFMVAFAVGVARQGQAQWEPRRYLPTVAGAALAGVAVVAVATAAGAADASILRYGLVDAVVAPALVYWLVRTDVRDRATPLVRLLTVRPLLWVGHRSFSIYLTHAVVLELLWRWGFDATRTVPQLVVYLAVAVSLSLLVGALFYRVVELPSARQSSRAGRARTPSGAGERPSRTRRPEETA